MKEKLALEFHIIDKKDWNLWLSAVLLILLLTLSLLIYFLPDLLNLEHFWILKPDVLSRKLGFLGLLILLYSLYSLRKHLEIRRLRYELMEKKIEMGILSKRLDELSNLFEVVAGISASGDLSSIYYLVVKNVCASLKAESCSLMLVEENSDALFLFPIASWGINAELVRASRVKLGEGIAGWVVKEGKHLLLNSEEEVARFENVVEKVHPINSAICVPLILDGDVIGVLNINRFKREKFTEGDLKLAQIFAHDACIAIRNARLIEENKQRIVLKEKNRLLQSSLRRYVPEKMASQILNNPERYLKLGGEKKDITILFADIRGFTSFSEMNEAERVVEILNQVFTELTKVVFAHNGYIDKYMGDSLLAVYDIQYTGDNEVFMALKTAVEMQEVFRKISKEWKESDASKLGLGIGINSGEVVIGNIGSEELMDYTVIGDNVNIALLLQEQAQAGQILVTKSTFQRVWNQVEAQSLPLKTLRGRTGEIEVYEVLKIKEQGLENYIKRDLSAHI
jgi:class 3 adenylate cyclase